MTALITGHHGFRIEPQGLVDAQSQPFEAPLGVDPRVCVPCEWHGDDCNDEALGHQRPTLGQADSKRESAAKAARGDPEAAFGVSGVRIHTSDKRVRRR